MAQRQTGGKSSTNVQAGGDVTIHQGISVGEVREIALDVFQRNFLDLQGIAETVVRDRAEKITASYLRRLESEAPEALGNAADPDVQRSIFNAQREFACSGEEDLELALVDLMVDRTKRDERDLQTIVLNEAINAVPKLAAQQRRAVALCFILRYTRFSGELSLDAFYDGYVRGNLLPLATDIADAPIAYQHIAYVGAGSVELGSVSSTKVLTTGSEGWFTKGFTKDEVPEELVPLAGNPQIFVPCIRDEGRLQLNAKTDSDIAGLASIAGGAQFETPLRNLLSIGVMPEDEVRNDLLSHIPEIEVLLESWDKSQLKNLTLTSVGIAIGYGYWRRVTGQKSALSIWIKD